MTRRKDVPMFGRRKITTSVKDVTKDNIVGLLQRAVTIHEQNALECDTLYNYYKGDQPILNRVKKHRPEINNKVVVNQAFEIVDFKKGYTFGTPVTYVRKSDRDGLSEKIGTLNTLMEDNDKHYHDSSLAEWFYICGTAYRMALPQGNIFEMDTLDPRSTFVVYSNRFGKPPVMGVTIYETDEGDLYCVYTKDTYYEIVGDEIKKADPHALNEIPIIEYPANNHRLGSFEVVLGLLNAINNTGSNRMDGIDQFIQSFVKFINCDIDEDTFEALRDLGAIKIKGEPGNPADMDIVSKELNQSEVQVALDYMHQMVLVICGMPDRQGAHRTAGDTGQAVLLRDGWSAAEGRAKDTEVMFSRPERRFLSLVLHIMDEKDITTRDIEIKFTRNRSDSLLVKSQGLQNLLEAGIAPEVAIKAIDMFSDPQQVYIDSKEFLEKWRDAVATCTPSNQKRGEPL